MSAKGIYLRHQNCSTDMCRSQATSQALCWEGYRDGRTDTWAPPCLPELWNPSLSVHRVGSSKSQLNSAQKGKGRAHWEGLIKEDYVWTRSQRSRQINPRQRKARKTKGTAGGRAWRQESLCHIWGTGTGGTAEQESERRWRGWGGEGQEMGPDHLAWAGPLQCELESSSVQEQVLGAPRGRLSRQAAPMERTSGPPPVSREASRDRPFHTYHGWLSPMSTPRASPME